MKDRKNKEGSAFNLYVAAMGYRQAAQMIVASEEYKRREMAVQLPLLLLSGFAVELGLKAYLMHKGWSHQAVTHMKIRHDLTALFEAAKAEGLPQIHPLMPDLVRELADIHRDYGARYLPGEGEVPLMLWPETTHVLGLLDEFLEVELDVGSKKPPAA